MPDMDFLSASSAPEPKKDDAAKAQGGDLSFHVPQAPVTPPPPPAPTPKPSSDMLGGLKDLLAKVDEPKKPQPTIAPKLPVVKLQEPTLPKPTMVVPPPPPKPIVAPRELPTAKPITNNTYAKPAPAQRDSLRVSLISSSNDGVGLTDLSVRARMRRLMLVAILALVFDGLVFGGILYYTSTVEKRVAGVRSSIGTLDAQIAQAEKDTQPAKDLQALLQGADDALKRHVHWTNVLAMLEQLIKPQIVLSGATLNETGTLSTTMTGPDYLSVVQQILVLRADPRVKSVPYTGASNGGGKVSIPLNITFDPKVLQDGVVPQTK